MKTEPTATPPDFDEDFLQAVARWKEQYKIQDEDPILLLMDLFRIHQTHWDELRERQIPSLDELRKDITVMMESNKLLKERADKEMHSVGLATAMMAAIMTLLAGFLLGHSL